MGVEHVILVDEQDREIGTMEKMEAHRRGRLHRAFSVFVFDDEKRLLLQQRATHKYHSGGLWTNTCCSHPRPTEATQEAAIRRLQEEMGIKADLAYAFSFHYRAPFSNGLVEHEFDHVFTAHSGQQPSINPDEVSGFRWIGLEELEKEIAAHPEAFTAWFKQIYKSVFEHIG